MADDVGSRFRHVAAYACCLSRQRAGGMPSQVREARTKELESSNAEPPFYMQCAPNTAGLAAHGSGSYDRSMLRT